MIQHFFFTVICSMNILLKKNASTDPVKDIRYFCCHVQPVPWVSPVTHVAMGWCVFLQDFRLKRAHCKIGHRVTIMSGAAVSRYWNMEGWWIWRSGFFVRFVLPKWAESTFSATWPWTLALKKTMSVSQWQHISLHRKVTWLVKYLFIHPNGMVSLQPSDRSVWSVFTCPLHISICVPFRI